LCLSFSAVHRVFNRLELSALRAAPLIALNSAVAKPADDVFHATALVCSVRRSFFFYVVYRVHKRLEFLASTAAPRMGHSVAVAKPAENALLITGCK